MHYVDALARLAPDACLRRESYVESSVKPLLPHLPIYVLSVPSLKKRSHHMTKRLTAAQATDVTWVECANGDDVARFDAELRSCVHPEYVPHPWSRRGVSKTTTWAMANGTISLQLKHQIAVWDGLRRKLPAAMVLEDDSMVPPDLWQRLAAYSTLPKDVDVFYLGSYTSRANGFTLSKEPIVSRSTGGSAVVGAAIHRRTNGTQPLLLGSNAYVVFAKAMPALLRPVRAEADVSLSLLDAPFQCRTQRGNLGFAPDMARCAHLVAPPQHQYGPSEWIIGQDLQGLEQKTHWDGAIRGPKTT